MNADDLRGTGVDMNANNRALPRAGSPDVTSPDAGTSNAGPVLHESGTEVIESDRAPKDDMIEYGGGGAGVMNPDEQQCAALPPLPSLVAQSPAHVDLGAGITRRNAAYDLTGSFPYPLAPLPSLPLSFPSSYNAGFSSAPRTSQAVRVG